MSHLSLLHHEHGAIEVETFNAHAIYLAISDHTDGQDTSGEATVRLSIAEARALAQALMQAVAYAEGERT